MLSTEQIVKKLNVDTPAKTGKISKIKEVDELEIKKRITSAQSDLKILQNGNIEFPTDAIPPKMLSILKCFADCSGFCLEYYVGSVIAAASGLIGNRYRIKAKADFKQAAPLYMALVGKSGIGKTPPMMTCFAPLFELEREFRAVQQVAMEKHHQEMFEYKNQKNKDEQEPKTPKQKEIILDDATIEDIANTLSENPIGCIVFKDELTGWIKSFNQYRAGGDQEFWLEVWNNPAMRKIGRVGKERLYIYRPYISILGGVQPEILNSLADGDKGVNGFLARFLFVVPTLEKIPNWNEQQPDVTVFKRYKEMIHFLYNLPHNIKKDEDGRLWNIDSIDLPLSTAAKTLYVDFYNRLIDSINTEDADAKRSQMSKLRAYCLRFALILHFLEIASRYDDEDADLICTEAIAKMEITEEAMKGAISLTNYFNATSHQVLDRLDSYTKTLPQRIQVWYKNLPKEDDFRTKIATELAKACDIPRATMNRYLQDEKLFRDMGRGWWRRRILM